MSESYSLFKWNFADAFNALPQQFNYFKQPQLRVNNSVKINFEGESSEPVSL